MAANLSETSYQLAWDKELNPIACKDPWGTPGAYSTLRMDGSPPRPLFIEDHLARLFDSLRQLGVASPVGSEHIGEKILSVTETSSWESPYLLRVAILEESFQLEARTLPPMGPWMEGKLLPYVRQKPEAKSLDAELFEHVEKLSRGTEEALLLAPNGSLGEASTSNLIFAKEDCLVAPKTNVLPGITLAKLLPALSDRLTVERRVVHLTDLPKFTEILATGSGKEVVAFARIPEVGWRAKSDKILQIARKTYSDIKKFHLLSLDAD